jgi:hypothetical protein
MILGMTLSTFTLIHVLLSLIGIGSGLAAMFGLLTGKRLRGWTALFLFTTVLTSVTGFLFPFHKVTPGIVIGVLSLIVLAVAIYARYARQLSGSWRWLYVVSAQIALYFNVFIAIVQAFEKAPPLKALAPTQTEPPFLVAQSVALIFFIVVTAIAVRRFRIAPSSPVLASATR